MATEKQKSVVKKLLENPGLPVSVAMEQSGYAPASSKNPQELTQSKGWAELMEEFIPDSLLAEKHRALLVAKVKTRRIVKGELVSETEEEDHEAIAKGLDMGYKLKGKYKPQQIELRSFTGWTPQELDDYAANGVIPDRFIDAGEGESRA